MYLCRVKVNIQWKKNTLEACGHWQWKIAAECQKAHQQLCSTQHSHHLRRVSMHKEARLQRCVPAGCRRRLIYRGRVPYATPTVTQHTTLISSHAVGKGKPAETHTRISSGPRLKEKNRSEQQLKNDMHWVFALMCMRAHMGKSMWVTWMYDYWHIHRFAVSPARMNTSPRISSRAGVCACVCVYE